MADPATGPALAYALGVPACIVFGALFAAVDASLVELGDARARAALEEGGRLARTARRLLDGEQTIRARLLAGRVLCNTLAAALAGRLAVDLWPHAWWAIPAAVAAVVLSYGAVVEIAVTLGRKAAGRFALPALFWLRPLELLMVPIAAPLAALARVADRVVPAPREPSAEKAEKIVDLAVENVIDEAEEAGAIPAAHAELIRGVLEFKDTIAREIMVPRMQVVAIDAAQPFERVLAQVTEAGHSRYPVYRGRLDTVVGMLFAKDLFRLAREGSTQPGASIEPLIRTPVFFVAETQKIGDLLRQMQAKRIHLAVVVDEYGGTAGIVTLEDILEEIVGDIYDEHDRPLAGVAAGGDGSYLVEGWVTLRDLNRQFDWDLPDDEAATIAGLVMFEAEAIPQEGEEVEVGGVRIRVEKRVRHQLTQLRVRPPQPRTGDEG